MLFTYNKHESKYNHSCKQNTNLHVLQSIVVYSWLEVLYVVSGLQCIHGTFVFPTRFLHFHICVTGSSRCGCAGLAFPNVDYVINFSFRCTSKDYAAQLNHAGRTARKGIVHTFFTPAYQVGHLNSSCTRLGCRRLNVQE